MEDLRLKTASARFPVAVALIWYGGFVAALMIAVGAGSLIDSDWGLLVAIVAFLIVIGATLRLTRRLRGRHEDAWFRARFPGYAGERIPLFHFIAYDGPDGGLQAAPAPDLYSLGVTPDALFLIRNRHRSDPPHDQVGGLLVEAPGGGFVHLDRATLAPVTVQELDDATIAAHAVDRSPWEDRVIEALANRLTGSGMTRKIIPMAAFVSLTDAAPAGWRRLAFAVPTEVPEETIDALGGHVECELDLVGLLAGEIEEKAGGEVENGLRDVVGDVGVDAVNEARGLLMPGGAVIGRTSGSRGRLLTRLIAAKLTLLRA